MSEVKRLERLEETPYMEARFSGPEMSVYYREASYSSHAYQCLGCGLVWDRKNLASACERHGHRASWTQHYGGHVENGVHKGGSSYERRAIRRASL